MELTDRPTSLTFSKRERFWRRLRRRIRPQNRPGPNTHAGSAREEGPNPPGVLTGEQAAKLARDIADHG